LRAKVSMLSVFAIDFLLSDVLMAASGIVLTYVYLIIGINQSFGFFNVIVFSMILGYVGLLFQAAFVSSYSNTKYFSQVTSLSKKYILATEGYIPRVWSKRKRDRK
jgi:hypothetical protein